VVESYAAARSRDGLAAGSKRLAAGAGAFNV
jgi:hypothetical protein